MKKVVSFILVALVTVVPLVASADAGGEKAPDTTEFTLGSGSRSDTTTGNLDGSQVFDRRWDVTYDGTCNATSNDSSQDGVSYQAFAIHSTATENLVAEVTSGALSDSVLFLYCDPFDPANPDQNLVAWDDDDGTGFLSAFTDADGYQIQANTTYYLVVTGWGPSDQGTFTLNLGGTAVFGAAGAPTPQAEPGVPAMTPWGLAAFLLTVAGVGLLLLRRRG